MTNPTVEAIRINPGTLAALEARARRARAIAVHSLVARLFQALAPKVDARPTDLRWG